MAHERKTARDLAVLYGLLWLLPTAFIPILTPMVRTLRTGNRILANPLPPLLRLAFLALLAVM